MAASRLSFKEPKKPKAETPSIDLDAELERLRHNVDERFGYGSLYWTIVDDNREKVVAFAKKHGYTMVEGMLTVGFWHGRDLMKLSFGQKPDKKAIKRMIKENKGGKTS